MRIWWSLPLPGPFRVGGTVWRSKSRRRGYHGVHSALPGWQCPHNHSRLDLATECANQEARRRGLMQPELEQVQENQEPVSEWKPEWRNQSQPPRAPRGQRWSELSKRQKFGVGAAITLVASFALLVVAGIAVAASSSSGSASTSQSQMFTDKDGYKCLDPKFNNYDQSSYCPANPAALRKPAKSPAPVSPTQSPVQAAPASPDTAPVQPQAEASQPTTKHRAGQFCGQHGMTDSSGLTCTLKASGTWHWEH